MCYPIVIAAAAAALAIGKAVSAHAGQKAAAQNSELVANLNMAQTREAVSAKSNQLGIEQSNQAFDTAYTSLQSEGNAIATQGALGGSPSSVISSINTGMFGIGRQDTVANSNIAIQRDQLGRELTGASVQRVSDIARGPQKPSGLSLALGIGGGVFKGVQAYSGASGKK